MGTVREDGVFPDVGEVVIAEIDGSRWQCTKEAVEPDGPVWEQLPEPGLDLGEVNALLAASDPEVGNKRRALGQAFAAWRVAFVSLDVVKTGVPGPDLNPPMALELVTRAMMVDALATLLDGMPLGLEAMARSQIATFLGDPEMAVVNSEINRLRSAAAMPPGAPGRDVIEAQKELQQLQSELDPRSDARSTISAIIDPRGQLVHTNAAGVITIRDLREAPEVLARQLAIGDKVPGELVQRAYDAAGKLVANRLARR